MMEVMQSIRFRERTSARLVFVLFLLSFMLGVAINTLNEVTYVRATLRNRKILFGSTSTKSHKNIKHKSKTMEMQDDLQTSSIEPSEWQEDFLILRNVCLMMSQPKHHEYALHLFSGDSGMEMQDFQSTLGVMNPYGAWDSDIIDYPAFHGVSKVFVANNQSVNNLNASYTYMNGTTFLVEPHHPDNNFHLHNDLLLPLLYRMIRSGMRQFPKNHKRRLYLTHGSQRRYRKRVFAFDILQKLFDEVQYPFESILAKQYNRVMCFERLVWSGKKPLPYYFHRGRFGDKNKWEGVIPEIRDWINDEYDIDVDQDTTTKVDHQQLQQQQQHANVANVTHKPWLTWVDRPCKQSAKRCLRNSADLIKHLSRRFDVHTLSFDNNNNTSRETHVKNMLHQMARTNIFVGFHGAGLAHTAYLQPGSIMVEIKDDTMREKKLFLNMANLQDVGYYLFDAVKASSKVDGTMLSDSEMVQFTDDLWAAWQQEKEFHSQSSSTSTGTVTTSNITSSQRGLSMKAGQCLFPQYLDGDHARLSSFEQSRCYLETRKGINDEWVQCCHYGRECE